jgi:protein PhnA
LTFKHHTTFHPRLPQAFGSLQANLSARQLIRMDEYKNCRLQGKEKSKNSVNFAQIKIFFKMNELSPCPACKSTYTYEMDNLLMCPECGHEWNPEESVAETDEFVVKDSNGNILQNGDSVVIIKNLPVKGSPQGIKAGTKVRNIRLVDSDHNIDCKIDGFGAMALKSEFVKKA